MKELASALSSINGVVAVGLGGSRGLGIANENSDYDFVLLRSSGESIAAQHIVDSLKQFTDSENIKVYAANFVTAQVSGAKIEIFQKDLSLIAREITLAKDGKFRWSIRPLFPHGDLSTGLISHIVHLELCSEMNECVSNLRRLAEPLPELLMRSLIGTFLKQAAIAVTHAKKIKKAEDIQYLLALCSGFVFYTNIVIFATNRMYPVIERGGAKLILGFPLRPKNYEQRISAIFQACCKGDLRRTSVELSELLVEIRALASQALEGSKAIDAQGVALKATL